MNKLPKRRGKHTKKQASTKRWWIIICSLLLLLALVAVFIKIFPDFARRITYPVKYREIITQYAVEYELDPAFIASIIYAESSYKPNALSNKGAMGLMQIMPDSGDWISGKLDEDDTYALARLYEPEINIRYGCWLLKYLKNRFQGDTIKMMAAYHAGGGNVDKWLKDERYSQDGITLTDIPFSQTNNYVKKVHRVYEEYKKLYAEDE